MGMSGVYRVQGHRTRKAIVLMSVRQKAVQPITGIMGSGALEPQVAFLAADSATLLLQAIVIGVAGHLVAIITIGDAAKLTWLWCCTPSNAY